VLGKLGEIAGITLLCGIIAFSQWQQNVYAADIGYVPVSGQITSPFGWRVDPMNGSQRFHGGIDIAAATGIPVYAPQPGYVVYSGYYGGFGNVVVLDHGHTLYTLYGHNSQLLVQAGQYVSAGQPISLVGSTGRSTGPHLHFEVHYNQQYLNPMGYLAYLQQNHSATRLLAEAPPVSQRLPYGNSGESRETFRSTNAHSKSIKSSGKSQTIARRVYPRQAYGRNVVQVLNGSNVENVEF
jgi:hypothetical protein